MKENQFKLSEWTRERIESLSLPHQLAFARRVCVSLVQCRVLQGRALLAVKRSRAYEECGLSSVLHFANLHLGMDDRDARLFMGVAEKLEPLPILTQAVERGTIEWSKLVRVLRRATPENEGYWLQRAQRNSVHVLERLLREDARGERGGGSPEVARLLIEMPMEKMELFQRAVRDLCHEAGRRLPIQEVLECFAFERLSGAAFPEAGVVEKWQTEIRKDLEAKREHQEWLESQPADNEEREPRQYPVDEDDEQLKTEAEWPGHSDCDCTDEEGVPEAPWEAVAADEEECPGQPQLKLVVPAVPHWKNDTRVSDWENRRLKFTPESRLLTAPQRREILRRDAYRCAVPNCPHSLFLECHHILFYCRGGVTIPSNLVAVCSRCHRHIHKGLLQVKGEAPRGLSWFDRHGRELGSPEQIEKLSEPISFEEELAHWLVRRAEALARESGKATSPAGNGVSPVESCRRE